MPRVNMIPVRVSDKELDFIQLMSKKSHIPPATIAYIALREYFESHGFDDFLEIQLNHTKSN